MLLSVVWTLHLQPELDLGDNSENRFGSHPPSFTGQGFKVSTSRCYLLIQRPHRLRFRLVAEPRSLAAAFARLPFITHSTPLHFGWTVVRTQLFETGARVCGGCTGKILV